MCRNGGLLRAFLIPYIGLAGGGGDPSVRIRIVMRVRGGTTLAEAKGDAVPATSRLAG